MEELRDDPKSAYSIVTVAIERYTPTKTMHFNGKMKMTADDVNAVEMVEVALHILRAVIEKHGDALVIQKLMEFGQENVAKGKFIVRNKNTDIN